MVPHGGSEKQIRTRQLEMGWAAFQKSVAKTVLSVLDMTACKWPGHRDVTTVWRGARASRQTNRMQAREREWEMGERKQRVVGREKKGWLESAVD